MKRLSITITLIAMMVFSGDLTAQEKPFPPQGELLTKQLKLAHQLYESDLKTSKTALLRMKLANKLTQDAIDSDDDTSKYALLMTAKQLSIDGADFIKALGIIDSVQNNFQIDALNEKYLILEQGTQSRLLNKQYKQIFLLIRPLIEECIFENNYDLAGKLGLLAKKVAAKTRTKSYQLSARDYNLEINSLKSRYEQFIQQQKALNTTPDDKVLNQEVGRFLCFVKNDWKNGLKLVARGDDSKLSNIAEMELQKNPDAFAIGNAWWKIAEKEPELPAKNIRKHAANWYAKSLPHLKGLSKTDVERKLSNLNPQDVIKATLVDPKKYSRVIAQDKHIGKAGDREEAIEYVLDFKHPIAVNDVRLRIKGQPASLNDTSNGAIFVSIDDGEWVHMSGWTTETSLYSRKFKGWLELSFKTADNKVVRQMRVLFKYSSGKSAFTIYHVGCVQ